MQKSILKGLFIFGFLCSMSISVFADESIIARFENPQGKTYYANNAFISKSDAGWKNDGIEGGITEILVSNGKLDVRYIDATNQTMLASEEGGDVKIFGAGINSVSILVYYPRHTIEIYNFYKDQDGNTKYIYTQTRSGEGLPIIKSSIYVGTCDFVYFDKISE